MTLQTHSPVREQRAITAKRMEPDFRNSEYAERIYEDLIILKTIIRCAPCGLVQFQTRSGFCRRCDQPLIQAQIEESGRPFSQDEVEPKHLKTETICRRKDHSHKSRNEYSSALRRAVARQTRECRQRLGFSQALLARKLGIPRSYLSRVENEYLLPGPVMLAHIAKTLRVDLTYFWAGFEAYSTSN
ncbi:MAG: XRE family transcriptional regulator [Acidobacteria bacterium]|nr:XRE family transcriptional regulator [Acidobacteriota bacterium]